MWKVHLFWFVQAAVFPAVTVAIFHWLKPTNDVFLSSLFCSADSDCPAQFLVPSMLVHNVTLLYAYFAILIFDVLPMCNAFAMTRGMKVFFQHPLPAHLSSCLTTMRTFSHLYVPFRCPPTTCWSTSKDNARSATAPTTTSNNYLT